MRHWFYASSRRATIAFAIEGDRVVACAPYGQKWLMGKSTADAMVALKRGGYNIEPLPEQSVR